MSANDSDSTQPDLTPVKNLPWFNTLREALAPYAPAGDVSTATIHLTSAEIISAVEQHHGVPQAAVGKKIIQWVAPDDFVRAMHFLGYFEANTGGLAMHWLMKER